MSATPVKHFQAKQIPKPQAFEEYDYEVATLENGFKILLVSSAKIDMAGCAIAVGVGSLNDPEDFQGLAHFCEHMLFQGTAKYPREEDFNEFVSQGGGVSNAFTADRETVYYAKVKPDFLEGLVDRFSQFLSAPMFSASMVDREVEAVNSEFEKNLQEDHRRKHDLWKSLSNPAHPMSKFGTGNNVTLRRLEKYSKKDQAQSLADLRDALVQFHKTYYSSNIMSAVVMGNQPMRALRDMCLPRFASVPNKSVELARGCLFGRPELPFRPEDLQKAIKIVPIREAEKTIDFRFIISDQFDFWRTKPASFLSHCIGHEGPGSLLAYLKSAGLATGLYSGNYMDDVGQSPFMVNIACTDQGMEPAGLEKIGEALFLYLRMLKETKVPAWAVEEEQALGRLRWRFRPMPSVEDMMTESSRTMLLMPPELVFEAPFVSYEARPAEILELLDQLNIANLNCYISARRYEKECKSTEQMYGTKYSCAPLDPQWVKRWRAVETMSPDEFNKALVARNIHFFSKNQFIPEHLDMKKGASKPEADPTRLPKTAHVLYQKQEARFKLPHFVMTAKIDLPTSRPTMNELISYLKGEVPEPAGKATSFKEASWPARYSAVAAFARVIMESLTEETYDATLAGVQFQLASTTELFSRGSSGIEIGGEGFDDKGPVIVKTLLDRLASLDVSDQNVNIGLEQMKRRLSNRIKTMTPYLFVLCKAFEVFVPTLCSEEELLVQLNSLTCDQLRKLTAPSGKAVDAEMVRGALIEGLVLGNVTTKEATTTYFSPDLWKSFVAPTPDLTASMDRVKPGQISLKNSRSLVKDLKDETYLKIMSKDITATRVAEDPRPLCFIYRGKTSNTEDANCAVALMMQSPDGSAESTAMNNLIQNWLYNKFFDDLRSKEALGYVVTMTAREHCAGLCRIFLVQSTKDSNFVAERIFSFLQKYLYNDAKEMVDVQPLWTPTEYEAAKSAVIASLSEQPKELKTLAQQYIAEIYTRRYTFDRKQKQVKFLQGLSYEQFVERLKEFVKQPWLLMCLDPKEIKFDYEKGALKNAHFVEFQSGPRALQAELFIHQAEKIDSVLSALPIS